MPPADLALLTVAAPAEPTPRLRIVDALKTVPPLDGLTEAEYAWLAEHCSEQVGDDGMLLFLEGSACDRMYIFLSGEVQVRRRHAAATRVFVGRAGQITGKLPFSRMKSWGGDGYAVSPVWALTIHESDFPAMLAAIPSMTQRCVSILLDRVREVTRIEQQAEKLAALGKLAANLAHELNNPASAAQRAAASVFGELRQYGEHKYRLGKLCLTEEQSNGYRAWVMSARARMAEYANFLTTPESPLEATDREDAISRWLVAHNIPEPWTIAPALAETRLPIEQLDELAAVADSSVLPVALATVASSLRVERMAETVVDSTIRIFDLISSIKDYAYMDQAPIQDVDLAQSLETTLAMLKSRLAEVTIEREYDPALPPVSAYGSELNQVWTALIENALDAMASSRATGPARLRITTRLTGPMAFVEIWDNGPGVDAAIKSRIFEPFFTTKAVGSGLGLGLDTAQRIVGKHNGYITVESRPGATCFQVRLPLDQAQAY
ncbi:MAG: histidine kinase [Acidobacteriota bacterium]|nr:histidine kinase [Acidobacteriota bacterium]